MTEQPRSVAISRKLSRTYREAHGDLRVPQRFVTEDGFTIGSWISSRRVERRHGRLSPERFAALDALGMVWDVRHEGWQRGIVASRAYREAHGNLRVPRKFVTEDAFGLGQWINNRRNERREGRLSPERIRELDALDMVWDSRPHT